MRELPRHTRYAPWRTGLPVSMTRFAGTTAVPVGSAVSTGVDESFALVRTSETRCVSEDVDESLCDSFAHKSFAPVDAVSPPYSLAVLAR
jgi:hypothetical protein